MIRIIEAATAEDIASAKRLVEIYLAWLPHDIGFQGIAAEMENFPGPYAPPTGAIWLARDVEGRDLGTVAIKALSRTRSELKRLWLDPAARGMHLGQALIEAAIAGARARGYADMVLDTDENFGAARTLYHRCGFVQIPDYNANPLPGVLWYGRSL